MTGWILELDRGRGIPYEGNYSSWLKQKQKRLRPGGQRGRIAHARHRGGKRVDLLLAQGPAGQVQGPHPALRRSRRQAEPTGRRRPPRSSSRWPSGSATTWSTSTGLSKGFGDKLLIDDLTFKLPPGGIVGVIGPNGAGKTTLFRMITGQEKPDAGTIAIGESVQLGYVDQSRDALDEQQDRLGGDLRRRTR